MFNKEELLGYVSIIGSLESEDNKETEYNIFKRFNCKGYSLYKKIDKYFDELTDEEINTLDDILSEETLEKEDQFGIEDCEPFEIDFSNCEATNTDDDLDLTDDEWQELEDLYAYKKLNGIIR